LPGTIGWNARVQVNGAGMGVQTNAFGFNITGTTNMAIVIEACTNLANPIWSAISTNTLNGGSFYFSDPFWTNYPSRFYLVVGLTFAGLSEILWNPQIQTGDGSFGVQANQFGFNITGNSNLVVVVQACTNLATPVWSPVATITLNGGQSYFSDPQWTNYPNRFYQLSSP